MPSVSRRIAAAGVDVAVLREHLEAAHGSDRVDVLDLLTGDEPERVEVVDRRVAEQPAGGRDVGLGRWRVVVGDEADGVDDAHLAGGHHASRLDIALVEPALEADLDRHPARLGEVDELARLVEVEGERLLDEARLAQADREPKQGGVGIGRRRDRDCVRAGHRLLGRWREDPADIVCHGLRGGRHGVGDDDAVDPGKGGQDPGVQAPDPAGPDQRNPHVGLRMSQGSAGHGRPFRVWSIAGDNRRVARSAGPIARRTSPGYAPSSRETGWLARNMSVGS